MPSNSSCTFPKYSHTFPTDTTSVADDPSQDILWEVILENEWKYSSRAWREYSMRKTELSSHQSKNRRFLPISSPLKKSSFNEIQSIIWPLIEKVPEPGLSMGEECKSYDLKKKKKKSREYWDYQFLVFLPQLCCVPEYGHIIFLWVAAFPWVK